MTLSRAVVSRITQLGGSGAEFDGVSFAGPLIFADWADYADEDVYGLFPVRGDGERRVVDVER
ncbi:hypothetical protein, partial [Microbacterium gubbeenense]|uniref:hypothetical protein n=1 Tax=Microbacterium gubbeenense TaxID=159896 RepID=UPI003F9BD897